METKPNLVSPGISRFATLDVPSALESPLSNGGDQTKNVVVRTTFTFKRDNGSTPGDSPKMKKVGASPMQSMPLDSKQSTFYQPQPETVMSPQSFECNK